MSARKTRLREYEGEGKPVFAAEITAVELSEEHQLHHPGAKTIRFMKPTGPSKAHMVPRWVEEHDPKVGDFFLVEDDEQGRTSCRIVHATEFKKRFKEKK